MAAPMDLNILWSQNVQSLTSSLQTAIKRNKYARWNYENVVFQFQLLATHDLVY